MLSIKILMLSAAVCAYDNFKQTELYSMLQNGKPIHVYVETTNYYYSIEFYQRVSIIEKTHHSKTRWYYKRGEVSPVTFTVIRDREDVPAYPKGLRLGQ